MNTPQETRLVVRAMPITPERARQIRLAQMEDLWEIRKDVNRQIRELLKEPLPDKEPQIIEIGPDDPEWEKAGITSALLMDAARIELPISQTTVGESPWLNLTKP